jgi:glucose/arabinose dehydrogenase
MPRCRAARRRFSNRLAQSNALHRDRRPWSLNPLEPRLLLAADAGAVVAEAAELACSPGTAATGANVAVQAAAAEIVFIDADLDHLDALAGLVREGVDVVLIDSATPALEQIDQVLRGRSGIRALHIVSHGQAGQLQLGGQTLDAAALQSEAARIGSWRSALHHDADILLYGCEVAAGPQGHAFVQAWSSLTAADVAASTDRTGAGHHRGNWVLEVAAGQVDTALLASPTALSRLDMLLPITIRAAGSTGLEQMQLQIDGVAVQTWDNVGGDADARQFQTFTFDAGPGLTADRVRVVFTNAVWNPSQGIDYNLRVDSIEIDGRVFESEDPSVFSTGTWLPADGVQPGFRQSEWLHANGYFQYAEPPVNSGSQITIYAAGSENTEGMELWIDGAKVKVWGNVGGDADAGQFVSYQYTAASTVTPGQVRVHFTGAQWNPAQGIDSNLRVDRIEIDGNTFETEDPSVFSTGTWLPADGIQPGFRQSEWLHANGYFQYADPVINQGSEITIFAAGSENTEGMELWIAGSKVKTWNNIGGDAESRQFVAYQFTAATSVVAEDVQVRFTNAQWNPALGIDNNLRVDRLVIDGVEYQTEAPNVYSTGTWQSGSITPGFKESEWLNASGFFEYGNARNAGVISLQTSVIEVDEDAGQVLVSIVRTVGSDGYITVDYNTETLTAVSGVDFLPATGTITFAEGELLKAIAVTILDDDVEELVEQFNFTIDNVNGGAVLLVPRTALVSIFDDDVLLPEYPDFASAAGLALNGAAGLNNAAVELTPAVNNRAGSAFFDTAITLDNDGSFRSGFSFRIDGGSGGADGLTFTIQNDPRGATAIGAAGGLLGYQGIVNSVAVEFDFFKNEWDVNDNHVSILHGTVSSVLVTKIPEFDLNDGSQYYAWVDYNGVSNVLAVYLSDTATKPALALLKTSVDLEAVVGDSAYFGFTAGTGGLNNSHKLLSWQVDQQVPPQNPSTGEGDAVIAVNVVSSGLFLPTAIDWLPDGTMLIAEKGGVVKTASNGIVAATPFIDISEIVNDARDRGLLDMAVHPDFENHPYVYLLFTYDPPEVYDQPAGTLAGPDGRGNRAGRLIRVTADVTNDYRTAVAGSEVVLLGGNSTWDNFNAFANSTVDFNEPPAGENPDGSYLQDFINSDSESHTVGSLAFGIDGTLFVSIGDGASYNNVDVRADRVQDIDSLSGKILRIDPLTGQGLADNPFYSGDPGSIYNEDPNSNRSKVYQLGLRNPFRISVDSVTGQLYVGDVGWGQWEEINAAGPGANFGWPFYEGGSGTSLVQTSYAATPEGQAFFAENVTVQAAIYALNHQSDNINAIVMGDVYHGSLYGAEYEGDVFFADLGQGIIRHASLDATGAVTDVNVFTSGSSVIVAIRLGPDGALYYVDLDDSLVGRWELV